jgi:hypothetical protein
LQSHTDKKMNRANFNNNLNQSYQKRIANKLGLSFELIQQQLQNASKSLINPEDFRLESSIDLEEVKRTSNFE